MRGRCVCHAVSIKGSNLLSELQMGHQNGQDMSCSDAPCTGKSFHRGLDRRDALGECGPEDLCKRLPMQIRHPAGGSLGQPNAWLSGPTSPLFPSPLGPASSQRRVAERRQQVTRRVGVTLSVTCSVTSSMDCQAKNISCCYFFPKSKPKHISRVSPRDNPTPQAKGQWRRDHCHNKNQSLDTVSHADGMLQAC